MWQKKKNEKKKKKKKERDKFTRTRLDSFFEVLVTRYLSSNTFGDGIYSFIKFVNCLIERDRNSVNQVLTCSFRRTVAPRWSIKFIFRFSILGRDRCHGLLAIGFSTLPYRKHKHARTELVGHFYVRQNKTKGIRRIEAEPRVLSRNLGHVIKDHRNECIIFFKYIRVSYF